jgi:hypothetical protein
VLDAMLPLIFDYMKDLNIDEGVEVRHDDGGLYLWEPAKVKQERAFRFVLCSC